jgi:hypothetical protein
MVAAVLFFIVGLLALFLAGWLIYALIVVRKGERRISTLE